MSEWQPIETAPIDGKEIIVCNQRQGNVMEFVYRSIHGHWMHKGEPIIPFQFTHWMPLPAPPSTA